MDTIVQSALEQPNEQNIPTALGNRSHVSNAAGF